MAERVVGVGVVASVPINYSWSASPTAGPIPVVVESEVQRSVLQRANHSLNSSPGSRLFAQRSPRQSLGKLSTSLPFTTFPTPFHPAPCPSLPSPPRMDMQAVCCWWWVGSGGFRTSLIRRLDLHRVQQQQQQQLAFNMLAPS